MTGWLAEWVGDRSWQAYIAYQLELDALVEVVRGR